MTPPEFSVLLLAWDDADPTVAVLGGAALPPTLPLVYQLAARQPVLAVYPHLPAHETGANSTLTTTPKPSASAVTSAPTPAAPAAEAAAPDAPQSALDAAVAHPGVLLLPGPLSENAQVRAVPALQSRIIGLANLPPASAPAAPVKTAAAIPRTLPAAPARSQWPTGVNAPAPAGQWQAPAAPYLGTGLVAALPPQSLPTVSESVKPVFSSALLAGTVLPELVLFAPAARPATARLQARQQPQAGDLNFDPDPELPVLQPPAAFSETTEEIGAAEAADLSAPEDDIVPHEPAAAAPSVAALPTPIAAKPARPAAPILQLPKLDGLNFRMIQYARQAAQLVRGRQDFGVIYAPNWPAWLAALEIRNSSGQPLVLYVAALAADFTSAAERGWLPELERMTVRRAALILVPDGDTHRRLLALYGEAMGEVRVVAAADEAAVQRVLSEVAQA